MMTMMMGTDDGLIYSWALGLSSPSLSQTDCRDLSSIVHKSNNEFSR